MIDTMRTLIAFLLLVLALGCPVAAQEPGDESPLRFAVSVGPEFARGPLTGRLFVLITSDVAGEPRLRLQRPGSPAYVFSVPVKDLPGGQVVVFDQNTPGYPKRLSELPVGHYAVQAMIDIKTDEHDFTDADGNGRSQTERIDLDPRTSGLVELKITREIAHGKPTPLPRIQYRRIETRSIGRHLGRRTFIDVAVVLPSEYEKQKDKSYPVQFWFPPYGTSAKGAVRFLQTRGIYDKKPLVRKDCDEFINVIVDGHTKSGNHYWVDSPNNGPWTHAFRNEVVPLVERDYRVLAGPSNRFLVGIGAGGWSALWLLAHNAQDFGGAWALSPDPVTFRSFYGIDLTNSASANFFTTPEGKPRVLTTEGAPGSITEFAGLSGLEAVMGPGGRISSFESSFSPRDDSGRPAALFDRETGALNPSVALEWSRYDLLGHLSENWAQLGSSLAGKIHVFAGEKDGSGNQAAVAALGNWLSEIGAAAEVHIVPGTDAAALDLPPVHERLQVEITRKRRWLQSRDAIRKQ